ncbi:centrosomal protein of 72 kDa isoform X1 [Alosa sapidissima]|uniref:centrosomal protein of 72 kDa isoform X1 n=1 Tax=Alosa sapidissima TaxID=34773 RepID=UPI001C087A29|nr:centrosomal protein of 72 kDa isoform X1 [Alosa sapidissima]
MRSIVSFQNMAAKDLTVTEEWIREKLQLHHKVLADVRTLCLPGNIEGKISNLGISLKKFVRLKTLDLSYNALVSVSGLEHLKVLERLNLYFNKISAFQEVMTLSKLKSLRELDLRLNPLVKKHPEYRLHLVHALCQLRKLDDCPVRDRERKAAIMHFTSDVELEHKQKTSCINSLSDQRSSDLRMAAFYRLTKSLALPDGNEEAAVNHINRRNRAQATTQPDAQTEPQSSLAQEIPDEVIYLVNDYDSDSFLQTQDGVKPAFRHAQCVDASRVQPSIQPCRKGSLTNGGPLGLASNRPRVTFADGYVKGSHSIHPAPATHGTKPSQLRIPATAVFTPDPRITLPSRNVYVGDGQLASTQHASPPSPARQSSLDVGDLSPQAQRLSSRRAEDEACPEQEAARPQRGRYRKPLDLLLSMVHEHWTTGNSDPQHYKTFFTRAVQVLSLMERELAGRDKEAQTLREEVQALNAQAVAREERHRFEIQELSIQLEKAHNSVESLDEQLRNVLEENVCLQKQLINLEQSILSSRITKLTSASDNGC